MLGMDILGLKESNPSFQHKLSHAHPYTSSVSSASSSSSSIFSLDGASSQSSISSASTTSADEHDWGSQATGRSSTHLIESSSRCFRTCANADVVVPPELRKHPRRTNSHVVTSAGLSCTRPPPCLLTQSERKVNFVDNLVDSASQIVEIIWPLSGAALRNESAAGGKGVLPLRTFIQETLRRSRTSYSTLQVALYYLVKIKPHVPTYDFNKEQVRDKHIAKPMQCGRRMFLAALILASKYLQDRNYSARAWSKISGLNTAEINQNELMFLEAVDWRLHIPEPLFQRWTDIVLKFTPGSGCSPPPDGQCWRTIIPLLTPELDTVDIESSTSAVAFGTGFDLGVRADSPSFRHLSTGERHSAVSTNENTPTCAPGIPKNITEPTPRMDFPNPSLPTIPRPHMLPTPQMTPQSHVASTPAASVGILGPRRSSISTAMSQAQNICMARSTLDQRPSLAFCPKSNSCDGYPIVGRRSSLARSASSASSPESMVSDVSSFSSRSSRSSSVSSIASGPPASSQSRLAVQATRRCATSSLKDGWKGLVIASPINETTVPEMCTSPDTYSGPDGQVPDLSNFSLGTPVDFVASAQEAAQSLCELSRPQRTADQISPVAIDPERRCRKRGRTGSEDLPLQSQVRQLINARAFKSEDSVLPDSFLADSFVVPESARGNPLSESRPVPQIVPHPRSGPGCIKRPCCGTEARKIELMAGMRAEYMN